MGRLPMRIPEIRLVHGLNGTVTNATGIGLSYRIPVVHLAIHSQAILPALP